VRGVQWWVNVLPAVTTTLAFFDLPEVVVTGAQVSISKWMQTLAAAAMAYSHSWDRYPLDPVPETSAMFDLPMVSGTTAPVFVPSTEDRSQIDPFSREG
jgi:hypothetical protein